MKYDNLISAMTEVVENTMKHYKSDFYKCDVEVIKKSSPCEFPMIWMVGESSTHLLRPKRFGTYNERLEIARLQLSKEPWENYLLTNGTYKNHKVFLVSKYGIAQCSRQDAFDVAQGIVNGIVKRWLRLGFKIRKKDALVELKFDGVPLSVLKSLIQDCRNHGDNSLFYHLKRMQRRFKSCDNHTVKITISNDRTVLYCQDYIDGEPGLFVALKFHGWPETGYMENGSVQFSRSYGWSSHS